MRAIEIVPIPTLSVPSHTIPPSIYLASAGEEEEQDAGFLWVTLPSILLPSSPRPMPASAE